MQPAGPSLFVARRWAAGAVVVTALAGVGLTLAYIERGPIGVRLATDYLQRYGVPATIRIYRLDTAGFSGSVSLGPAGDPDLTVDRLDVTFEPMPLWRHGFAAPRIRAIRLVRPQIRARFDGRGLTFGSLQRLVDEAQRGPSGAPGPSVAIQDGRVRLDTPAGQVIVLGDGALDRGRIAWVSARLAPCDLRMSAPITSGLHVDGMSGELHLTAQGADRLNARWRLTASGVAAGAIGARTLDLDGVAEAPYGLNGFARLDGPIQIDTALGVQSVRTKEVGGRDVRTRVHLVGDVHGSLQALHFAGPASAMMQAASADFDDGAVSGPVLHLDSSRLVWDQIGRDQALRLQAPLHVMLQIQGGRVSSIHRSVALGAITTDATGDVRVFGKRLNLNLTGAALAQASLGGAQARQVARAIVPDGAGAALRDAVARNLQTLRITAPAYRIAASDTRLRLDLAEPIRTVFADGGAIEVSGQPGLRTVELSHGVVSGAAALRLGGPGLPTIGAQITRYRIAKDQGDAEGSLDVSGSIGPAHAASFALRAFVEDRNGQLRLIARDCAKLTLEALENGPDTVARDATAALCPSSGAPLFALHGPSWSATGRVEAVSARLPTAEVQVSDIEGAFALRGEGPRSKGPIRPVGRVTLAHVRLVDTAKQVRFNPLTAAGAADLTQGSWRGRLDVDLAPAEPPAAAIALGRLTLIHDPRTQRGEARFTAALRFAPNGFQPASVAPQAGQWLSEVQGVTDVSVEATWGDGQTTSRADIRTTGLDLKSPAGHVAGLRGDLRFAALAPLRSEPDQRLDADRVDTLLPLTALSATFDLDPTRLVLHQAGATVADGQVGLTPMTVALSSPGSVLATSRNDPIAQGALTLKDVELGEVVKVLNLSNAVSIQARIDGVLPFAFGPAGLRLSGGRVSADGLGRITIRRQALTGATAGVQGDGAQNNAVQDFAYQALENLAFDSLEADVASRPQGRLGVVLHVKGRHDPPTAPVTRIGLIDLLRGHAFDKPIPLPKGTPVDLTLDSSLNFDELLAAYGGLRTASGSADIQPDAPK